jgi:hypothetical protein
MNIRLIPFQRNNYQIYKAFVYLNILFLSACAGQQSARELAGLEIATMLDYKQAINKTITAENRYYESAKLRLNSNLVEMNSTVVSHNSLAIRAKRYDHLWQNKTPSQYDILGMINTVHSDYSISGNEYTMFSQQINEQYFSKIKKLNTQQENLDKSIAALKKLYAREEFNEQTNLIRDYLINTVGTVRKLSDEQN